MNLLQQEQVRKKLKESRIILVLFFSGRIIPGSTMTYQEVVILHTRDYLVNNGLAVDEIVNADLVRCVRVRTVIF